MLTLNSHDGGDSTFYSCFTGDNGAWNIYSKPLENEPTCTPVWLNSPGCHEECVVTTTMTAPCTTSSAVPPVTYPVPPPSKATCPVMLPPDYEFPHLIVPVRSESPDMSYGTSYNGTASSTVSSICEHIPATLSQPYLLIIVQSTSTFPSPWQTRPAT